jgi:hypothetical protein
LLWGGEKKGLREGKFKERKSERRGIGRGREF